MESIEFGASEGKFEEVLSKGYQEGTVKYASVPWLKGGIIGYVGAYVPDRILIVSESAVIHVNVMGYATILRLHPITSPQMVQEDRPESSRWDNKHFSDIDLAGISETQRKREPYSKSILLTDSEVTDGLTSQRVWITRFLEMLGISTERART